MTLTDRERMLMDQLRRLSQSSVDLGVAGANLVRCMDSERGAKDRAAALWARTAEAHAKAIDGIGDELRASLDLPGEAEAPRPGKVVSINGRKCW